MPFRASVRARAAAAVSALAAAVFAVVLVTASPASAHDVLAGAVPAADASVGGDVDRVVLTFSEPPLAGLESGIVVSVTAPGGAEVGTGAVRVDGSTLTRGADLSAAGRYTVTWRSVSVDGHPISGSYGFTSTGAVPSPSASAGTPTPSATAAAAETPVPSATTTAAAAPATTTAAGAPGIAWVLGGVAVLVAAALVTALLLLRRRSRTAD